MNENEAIDVVVVNARVRHEPALEGAWDAWLRAASEAHPGLAGATAGVAETGEFVAMLRIGPDAPFRLGSVDAWAAVDAALTDVTCVRTTRTDVWNRGGNDQAGFVQIRQGTSPDPERLRHLYVVEQPIRMGPHRPEVLGGMFAWDGPDRFTLSAYFTSEAAARNGENLDAFAPFFADIDAVMDDVTYLDLPTPWLWSSVRVPI